MKFINKAKIILPILLLLIIISYVSAQSVDNEYWDIVKGTLDMSIQQPLLAKVSEFTLVDVDFENQYLSIFDNLRSDLITSIATDGVKEYINKENAEKNIQLGIEEVFHEAEISLILTNTNLMWGYVILIFQLIGDLMLTLFYFVQFLLLIYILFVFIPKMFLMLRDGLVGIMIKMYKKKYKR